MKLTCKTGFTSFGFLESLEEPLKVEAGDECVITKLHSDKYNSDYYALEVNGNSTTLSKDEVLLYFEIEM